MRRARARRQGDAVPTATGADASLLLLLPPPLPWSLMLPLPLQPPLIERPSRSDRAWASCDSGMMWLPPTKPMMRDTLAFAAEPTPVTLSSTAMHRVTGTLSAAAALRYTAGSGLKRGGLKSLSPLWILSSGNQSRSRAVSTHTGTLGLGLLVEMAYLNPLIFRKFSALMTPSQGRASSLRLSTVSSFCLASSEGWSSRVSSNAASPSAARAAFTSASTAVSSEYKARTSSMGGSPAALRSSSTFSSMNSNALPALRRM
mmetsp:Transcript_6446/g.16461  ORF Transcript_6446/g.16461 Transcript_6446/m.16461 type:complete len:259 (+) Transcript_6446:684-1460(+)